MKRRAACKSRLSPILSQGDRLSLVRTMLDGVVTAAAAAPGIDGVAIVSPERDTVRDNVSLFRDSCGDLNAALTQAVTESRARGIGKVIILPADLPNLARADVSAMSAALHEAECVLAPDRHETGTNGIGLDLNRLDSRDFRFCFGKDSFHHHAAQASLCALQTQIVRTPGLAFDLDEPDDLRMLPDLMPMVHA